MRDMPIEEYMNYIENFADRKRNETNFFNLEDMNRINKFMETIRKNIEKFKGKQNILQINCQPIDYIETVGNGLGNNIFSRNDNILKNGNFTEN